MDYFRYRDGQLYCEDVNVDDLAMRTGTPSYIYSAATFENHFNKFKRAFDALNPIVCFSIKGCGNVHILRRLVNLGSGMDVVSGGELFRARAAGVDCKKIVYAGVGKTDREICEALEAGIGWFNIESESEFETIAALAKQRGIRARAALRVNPNVADPATHAKTRTGNRGTKFGVDIDHAKMFFEKYGKDEFLELSALHMHLGSPIYSSEPYVRALELLLGLISDLKSKGYSITALDVGGGFSADYETGRSPSYEEYAAAIVPILQPFVNNGGQIILEPGRTISANAGVLVARVLYVKHGGGKRFIIVDTGMHHLIRATLYEAQHFIWPTRVSDKFVPDIRKIEPNMEGLSKADVVGPICESSDYLAKDRMLPEVRRGDLLCIFSAGAYGMVMASQYNAMPRPPEILVDGGLASIIRTRETYGDLVSREAEAHVV